MMHRRDFFGRLGAVTVAGATGAATVGASPGAYPDDFEARGHSIRWLGWRQPIDRAILFGVWAAFLPPPADGWSRFPVQTTLGHHDIYREMDTLDCSWYEGWPKPATVWLMSEPEREALKQRACRALLESL